MTESLVRVLRDQPFVSEFTDEQVRYMAGCAANQRYQAGQRLFKEHDPADRLYLIRHGSVVIELHQPGRGALQLESLGDGDLLGWSVFFPPYVWHVDARALTGTTVLVFDGRCLREKMAEDAAFAYALTRRVLLEVHRRLERARLSQADVYGSRAT